MFALPNAKYNLFGWVLLCPVLFWVPQAAMCSEQPPRVGTLHVEGEGIERLVLQGSTGPRMVYYYREPNLVLPEGSYRLEEVVLQGDYSSLVPRNPGEARVVKIEPGGFATVKLGAPLQQTIRVERWGTSLVLNYQLLGRGGESYAVTQRQAAKPPAFVIYQGENQVASGDFEPG
jgi:hypothetical protein